MFVKATVKEVSIDELLEEMWKTIGEHAETSGKVLIHANPHKIEEQRRDMKIVEELLDRVKEAKDRDDVFVCAAIAVGYANAMQVHENITEPELKRLNTMIGAIAERRLVQIGKIERRKFFDRLLRFGKVGA